MQARPIDREGRRDVRLKALGLLSCGLVVGLLLLFAVGEGVEGFGHLLQAAPLVALMMLAWWRPLIGGTLILAIAIGLVTIYVVRVGDSQLAVVMMFFVPTIVGGLLLIAAGRRESRRG